MTAARPGPPDRAPDAAGQLLGERYRLGTLVGRGGAAAVYRGHDCTLDRTVAIKLLHPDRGTAPGGDAAEIDAEQGSGAVARLRREARLVASLNHPNLVAVYDIGTYRDALFLVMEYVHGQSLRTLLAEHGPLGGARVVELGAAVCAGLDAAHARDVIHRDVTPGNILAGTDGATKLTDFGIARATHGLDSTATTADGHVRGTPAYMSPEQVLGHRPDARSDVYSLGCCLYEIATGRPPFAGDFVAVAHAHVHEHPDPPSARIPAIPAVLEAVLLRALAKEPARRYQSAAAMQAALTHAGGTGEATADLPSPADGPAAVPRRSTIAATSDRPAGPPGDPPDERTIDDELVTAPETGALRRRLGVALVAVALALLIAAVLVF